MPRPSVYDIPAQTLRGQVSWGEALYLRDLGDPEYGSKWPGFEVTRQPSKLLKLAALFDLFNLQDCAVELLLQYAGVLEATSKVAVDEMLAAMVPRVAGHLVSHAQFLDHCRALVRERRYKDIPI